MNAQKELLHRHVEFLTTLRPFRNYQNPGSLDTCCDYFKARFLEAGLSPVEQKFTVNGTAYKNIVASYLPGNQRRLVVGAHYDVCGNQPGADDNASAVAGLLEVARMVAESQPAIDYRIDFVCYCLEEPPFFATRQMGSYIHAESISPFKSDIIGVINFEMIGYFHQGAQEYPDERLKAIYPATADFIAVVGKQKYHEFNLKVFELMKTGSGIDVQMIDDPLIEGLAGMSDQRSYWEFDIPALMINDTSFIRNPRYHQLSDDIETLSFDHMREVVNSAYRAITGFQAEKRGGE